MGTKQRLQILEERKPKIEELESRSNTVITNEAIRAEVVKLFKSSYAVDIIGNLKNLTSEYMKVVKRLANTKNRTGEATGEDYPIRVLSPIT